MPATPDGTNDELDTPPQFNPDMYRQMDDVLGSRSSAMQIAPIVCDLVPVRSVLDVGCGVGSWLSVFQQRGVDDVFGLDVSHVPGRLLQIPPDRFRAVDLHEPFRLDRRFDLAICLEAAQYVVPEKADALVESLTLHAPAVLFSAAVPFQIGPGNGAVNQQWPTYWLKLFESRGYVVVDCVRRRVWRHPEVRWWYAQNALLYVKPELIEGNAALQRERDRTCVDQLSIVHPEFYRFQHGFTDHLRALFPSLRNALQRRRTGRAPAIEDF